MSFGERIKQYITYKGLSVRSFEIKSGLKNGAVYRVIKNNTSLNGESIAAIGRHWKDLNLNWLMIEEGEMLIGSSAINEPANEYNKHLKTSNELKWFKDALQRADSLIEQQQDLIDALKQIIESQKRTAEKAGIEL